MRRRSDEIVRLARWKDWFDRAFLLQLDDNERAMAAAGITLTTVEARLVGDAPRPLTRQQAMRGCLHCQRQVMRMLPVPTTAALEVRVRRKLRRWTLPGFPRAHARRR